jgi:hypothetical protein
MLKKILTTGVALIGALAMCASIASATKPSHPEGAKDAAAKQCAAEKKADKAAFKGLYGKHAMRNCIKGETDESKTEATNASKECKAERDSDPAAFEETYPKNGIGKCVSARVKAEDADDADEFQNAAKECKSERSADPEGFRETYGSEHSKGKNALGKCVSTKVREDEGEQSV